MDMQLELFAKATMARHSGPIRGDETHRAYFTLIPPPTIAQDVERGARLLARRAGARSPVRADRLHVSLNMLWRSNDEPPTALLDEALEVGNAIRRPGFDLVFDLVQTWSGRDQSRTGGRSTVPTVLACSRPARDAIALYADIARQLQRGGLPVSPRSFSPHLTVWYDSVRVPDFPLRRPYAWPVRKFWLVRTVRGAARPQYIGEWSLG